MLVHLDALVMVVDGDSELLLGFLLADDVLIQVFLQLEGFRQFVRGGVRLLVPVVLEDLVADRDAFIANVGAGIIARRGNQLADNVLALVAEGTAQGVVRTRSFHQPSPTLRHCRQVRIVLDSFSIITQRLNQSISPAARPGRGPGPCPFPPH